MSSTLRLSSRQLAARATAAAAASLADLQLGTSAPEVRIYTAPRPGSVAAGPGAATLLVAVQHLLRLESFDRRIGADDPRPAHKRVERRKVDE